MEHAIVEKLRRELDEPIKSERQVVYLLVELRKLMEINNDFAAFPALRFACDWVAHPVMDRTEAKKIIQQFDRFQQIAEGPYSVQSVSKPDASLLREAFANLKLANFRQQLSDYLARHKLDCSIAHDNAEWATFLTYFASVVEDCPLKCRAKGQKYVDEAVLKVHEVIAPEEQATKAYKLLIMWSWKSKVTGQVHRIPQQF